MVVVVQREGVSGLEDGVQDGLVVGGDVVRMPFEDGKGILIGKREFGELYLLCASLESFLGWRLGVYCWTGM